MHFMYCCFWCFLSWKRSWNNWMNSKWKQIQIILIAVRERNWAAQNSTRQCSRFVCLHDFIYGGARASTDFIARCAFLKVFTFGCTCFSWWFTPESGVNHDCVRLFCYFLQACDQFQKLEQERVGHMRDGLNKYKDLLSTLAPRLEKVRSSRFNVLHIARKSCVRCTTTQRSVNLKQDQDL